jgi:hypothetical protein
MLGYSSNNQALHRSKRSSGTGVSNTTAAPAEVGQNVVAKHATFAARVRIVSALVAKAYTCTRSGPHSIGSADAVTHLSAKSY